MPNRYVIFTIIATLLVISYLVITNTDFYLLLDNSAFLKQQLIALGVFGPVLIILLMVIAIVMSPLPSAPIALVAGAVYGHVWGSLYVLVGASLGAFIAFFIARLLGYDVLKRWFGGKLATSWVNSPNALTAIIFISRLMPFVSFDMVSYAAGLTSISFWRFAIATVAGIAPASFALAHFGSELTSADSRRIAVAILLLGIIGGVSFIIQRLRQKEKKQRENDPK